MQTQMELHLEPALSDGGSSQEMSNGAGHAAERSNEKWIQVAHGGRLQVQRKGRSATVRIRQRSSIQGLSNLIVEEACSSPAVFHPRSGKGSFSSEPEINRTLDMHMPSMKRLKMNASRAAQRNPVPLSSMLISKVPEHGKCQVSASSAGQLSSLLASCLSFPFNSLDEPSPLGLTLRKTPSLINLVQMKLGQTKSHQTDFPHEERRNKHKASSIMAISEQEKPKAANFPASMLRIGGWEWVSRRNGDLVVKFYYAKRKLVWEVLEQRLKSKLEISWSDITVLEASCPANEPGVLGLEVSRPPLFFKETNPQPRKHTFWQPTSDFTRGEASLCKCHYLKFEPGLLNRHYEKLIDSDPRLKMLSEKTLIKNNPACVLRRFEGQNEGCFQQPYSIVSNSLMQLQNCSNELLPFLSSCDILSASTETNHMQFASKIEPVERVVDRMENVRLTDSVAFRGYNNSNTKENRDHSSPGYDSITEQNPSGICFSNSGGSFCRFFSDENAPISGKEALDVYSQHLLVEKLPPRVFYEKATGGSLTPVFSKIPLHTTLDASASFSFLQPTYDCLQQM